MGISNKKKDTLLKHRHSLTSEEAKNCKKLSDEAKERNKTYKRVFKALLNETTTTDGQTLTIREATALAVVKKAVKGDLRAFELIRDTIGEKPLTEIKTQNTVTQETAEEVERLVNSLIQDFK